MQPNRRACALTVVLAAGSAAPVAAQPPTYTIRDLGVLKGGGESRADVMNNTGLVAGFAHRSPSVTSLITPMLWGTGDPTSMLPQGPDGVQVSALSVNDKGTVIFSVAPQNHPATIYRWRNGVAESGFVATPPGTTLPLVWRTNNTEFLAGSAIFPDPVTHIGYQKIVRWSPDGQNWEVLGSLGWQCRPDDMNSAGDIVGLSYLSPSGVEGVHPFVIRNNQIADLSVGITDRPNGDATAINDSGQICGWVNTPGAIHFPATWSAANVRTLLPMLAGSNDSIAWDLNGAGAVVGFAEGPNIGSHAVLWTGGQVYDLEQQIAGGLTDGWLSLWEATAINSSGQIAGFGVRDVAPGVQVLRAFLLTPVCYANCDLSTTPPLLNANDFVCFINRFAAGDSYANCDASTTPPVLNAADFVCFAQQFASGCP